MSQPGYPEHLEDLRERVEAAVRACLPPAQTRPALLHEAMRTTMENGGKRLRPVLLLAAAELFPAAADALPAAVAVECIHAYSLVHDDLPCMDNADLRRGQPTCHKRYGEANALLVGDALLTYAFELLSRSYAEDPAIGLALVRELGTAAGSARLIGGQVEDLAAERGSGEPDLAYIHENKTAALLRASLRMGGIVGGAKPAEVDALGDAGTALGHAFQIIDDLLDTTSDTATLGKTTGTDARNDKVTYVTRHGLEAARKEAARRTAEVREKLKPLNVDTGFLLWLIEKMEKRAR